jgi:hypothetical protein
MIYGIDKLNGTHPYLWATMAYLGYRSKYDWKVTSGPRTNQAELYAQGRTTPGPIITDAKPGESAHEFGEAVDAYPTLDKGKTIVTDYSHPAWDERDALLRGNAFFNSKVQTDVVISSGPDRAHVQVRYWKTQTDWRSTWAGFAFAAGVVSLFLLVR